MQLDGLPENNMVLLTGTIIEGCVFSHEVYGEGFYTFRISSERLSDKADILPITISERLIEKELLQVGGRVEIAGQLRSYNNYNSKKNRLVLTVFAREIRMLEEAEDRSENQIFLNGFICKAPIYRKTPFGREISDILVAVNRAYNKSDYIPCIAWGRNARYMANLEVGANIRIWGRVQSRTYQKRVGDEIEDRIAYEVSVSKIELPGRGEATEEGQEVPAAE
ncbi:MAG: single-stranded DNA-binding protein [Anaerotignum sp.]|nr:single-stranded DNA-binding protein [Anaerotignum sp.]MBQ3615027.1 single-stranded DNA-binding protein [Anaerotignum sp.]MBQ7084684.1 single-stranded DNA-binding protein [Anaerotignum sp.]MBR2062096.1 single-stranded DNA-binding protein [Anaerotignum sp.]MBR2382914.1 single-stranded DNA-binding protein [Anaerotignum sp.]